VIEGKALNAKGKGAVRRHEVGGVDYLAAAESRLRQLQAHNMRLERQIRLLKEKLEEGEALGRGDGRL
jgi:cell division protein FtsB